MANKKYKGNLKRELTNGYGDKLMKGQEVLVYKRRVYNENNTWTGEWEYHYHNIENTILIRTSGFLI